MLNPSDSKGIVLTPEQVAEKKEKMQADQKKKQKEFKQAQEELMRKMGVIQFPIIKIDPIAGIIPDAVIIPHEWKKGETYLVPEVKPDGKK